MDKQKLLEIYKEESAAQFLVLEEGIVKLEKNPGDVKLIQEVFRAAHTLKGNSRMMGFNPISDVAHHLEDLFDQVQQGKLVLQPQITDILLESVDVMKKGVQNAGKIESGLFETIMQKIKKAFHAPASATAEENEVIKKEPEIYSGEQPKTLSDETIRVPISRINNLLNLTGEMIVSKVKSAHKINLFKKLLKQMVSTERMIFDLKIQIKEALGVGDEWIHHQGAILRGSKEMGKALPALNLLHHLELIFDEMRQNMIQLFDQLQTETFQLNPVIEELQERMKDIIFVSINCICIDSCKKYCYY